ncbi:MAG: LLM class flavin-dependent oxidoreductase [Dehalococcoidia bacterium]
MGDFRIGVAAGGGSGAEVVQRIERLEDLGVTAAWLTTAGAGPDGPTILSAAAARTERILLGTSIVPTWPRHPVVQVQQAQVIASLAPGRFRLGIGPSHKRIIERVYGIPFDSPMEHFREYFEVVKTLLQEGRVDFDGATYKAHASIPEALPNVPVMASALQRGSYEFSGAHADGAISWMCPLPYLRDVALPAMQEGARDAGRQAPPLIAHIPATVYADADEVRESSQRQFGNYVRLPFYNRMFAASGYPEAGETQQWSARMVDEIVAYGSEERVAERISEAFNWGASEVLVTILEVGADPRETWERTAALLGNLSASG